MTRKRRLHEWLLSAPSLVWLAVFFVVPGLLVFAIAFKPVSSFGGIGDGWTLATFRSLSNPSYPAIAWRTLWLSVLTTVFCLLLAVPTAYQIARCLPRTRNMLVLLVIVPFWTSFLIRIFAWRVLLHPDGLVKHALVSLGIAGEPAVLLYNPVAVLLVMVYSFLPFAVLPLYAAAERFDWNLLDAARDLGAGSFRTFTRVFIPGIGRGLVTASLVVFIPALGSYVIPDLVGGPGSEMIGNKIAQRTFVDRNLPHASLLSAILMAAVILPLVSLYGVRAVAKKRDSQR